MMGFSEEACHAARNILLAQFETVVKLVRMTSYRKQKKELAIKARSPENLIWPQVDQVGAVLISFMVKRVTVRFPLEVMY